MNSAFWIGVYPGISEEMMEYMIEMLKKFIFDTINIWK